MISDRGVMWLAWGLSWAPWPALIQWTYSIQKFGDQSRSALYAHWALALIVEATLLLLIVAAGWRSRREGAAWQVWFATISAPFIATLQTFAGLLVWAHYHTV